MNLFLVSLFYVSVFMQIAYCFDYYSFVIQFEIMAHDASNFSCFSGFL